MIAAALVGGCVPGPVTIVVSPSPTASPTVPPSARPSPTADPSLINVTTPIGPIPRSFHYFDVGQGASYRILLFDEERTEPPSVVLTSGQPPVPAGPDVRSDAFSVSADGRVVVVMRRLSAQQTSYYVLRPETGELRTLFSGADLGPPLVSADGQRIAFARTSDDSAVHGVWMLAIPGAAAPTRLVTDMPQRFGSPPQPLAWSDDGKWLAISLVIGIPPIEPAPGATPQPPGFVQAHEASEVAVVDPTAGETHFNSTTNSFEGGRARVLGSGFSVDWRAGEHSLLITSTRTRSGPPADALGGRTHIYTADVTGGLNSNRDLYAPSVDVTLGPTVWHPSLDRFATMERPSSGASHDPTAIWVRRLDGTATKVAESRFLSAPWWSRDGTKLFAIGGGDDSNGGISDLLGTGSTPFCVRGGTPPRCT
jgi:hypothetical protein